MARTWVKLHLKILDSYDMELLPDSTYRRAIQLLCIAGREDTDGWLPDPRRIAWQLRIPIEQLAQEMEELLQIEYLVYDDVADTWCINHWATYQTNSDPGVNERVQRFRDKHRQNGNVIIKEDGNVTCNVTETDTDKDKDKILQIEIREDTEIGANAPSAQEPDPVSEPESVKKSKADPRSKSPEIQLFKAITGENPHKSVYDQVISAAHGKTVDELRPFFAAWCGRGYNPRAVTWLTEWAVSGNVPGPPARAAPNNSAPESVVDKLRYLSQESDRRNGNGKPG